jgi:hypothetical protein
MALIRAESFDHVGTTFSNLNSKGWTTNGATITSGTGRRSTNGLNSGTSNTTTFSPTTCPGTPTPSGATCLAHFSITPGSGSSTLAIFSIWESANGTGAQHVSIRLNTDGSLTALRGSGSGTALASTSAGVITLGVNCHLQIKVTIADSSGYVEIRKDGSATPILTFTGDTQNAGTATWKSIQLQGGSHVYDDFVLLDGTGSVCNDFLGDVRVDAHYPNANGTSNMSTPSAGTDRYATIDETSPNTTDYNSLAAVNDKDTVNLQSLVPTGATIIAVQRSIYCAKSDAGAASLAGVYRSGGSDYAGTGYALSTAWGYICEPAETDPATGMAFTETNFNALEAGYQRTA